jgi:hypothetical protein
LEADVFGKDTEQYRTLCFYYNLRLVSDEDLNEYAKSIFERRECDPEVIRRIFAPIPPDAPSHLVKRAKALSNCRDIPGLDLKQVYQEILEWKLQ